MILLWKSSKVILHCQRSPILLKIVLHCQGHTELTRSSISLTGYFLQSRPPFTWNCSASLLSNLYHLNKVNHRCQGRLFHLHHLPLPSKMLWQPVIIIHIHVYIMMVTKYQAVIVTKLHHFKLDNETIL